MEISTTTDLEAFVRPACFAWGVQVSSPWARATIKLLNPDRAHVAYANGEIVGAIGAFPHTLTVPGGTIAAAGAFAAGVLPSHRRRGILTQLMETQRADAHRRGEAVVYGWPSEGAIYGRFGWGLAHQTLRITVPAKSGKLRGSPDRVGEIQILERNEAYERIAPIYARVCNDYPGMYQRSEAWWRVNRLSDPDLFHVVWEDQAYALYLVKLDPSSWSSEVEVVEALSTSIEGHRQIWRYLLELDLMKKVSASYLPMDHPLMLMLEDSSKMNVEVRNGLWVNIVDVETSLAARAFGEGSVVIRVVDNRMPHNAGLWSVGQEGVRRVGSSPDLTIDIADLGSAYLAGFSFSELARSGRVREEAAGGIRRADRLFAWNCKPWCPQVF